MQRVIKFYCTYSCSGSKMSHVMRKPIYANANNKGADQTVQMPQRLCCSLLS